MCFDVVNAQKGECRLGVRSLERKFRDCFLVSDALQFIEPNIYYLVVLNVKLLCVPNNDEQGQRIPT